MTSTASPLFDTVLIVGIGHIGSSVAVNIRHAGLARRLLASDQSADHEAIAVSLGHVDAALPLEEAAGQADLVILCAPVGAVEAICEKIAPHLKDNCIVSDVGSTKLSVLQAMERQLGNNVHAVPAHPIAGIEKVVRPRPSQLCFKTAGPSSHPARMQARMLFEKCRRYGLALARKSPI